MTTDKNMQNIIGILLRTGVFASISIATIGGAFYIFRHGNDVVNYTHFNGVPDFVRPANIFQGIIMLRGRAIIQAGIALLIATPVIRIIFSAIGFALEKDYMYTAITLLVLGIIIFSMVSGVAG